jgi:preprotein translocase subunit SecE
VVEPGRARRHMGGGSLSFECSQLMAKTSPVKFIEEVREEVARVTWPTRKETVVTTAMVFVMVFIAAGFFFVVDQVFSAGVRLIFGLGS